MSHSAPKRKLIEVAVPLEAINSACKADKDRKTGTIRNLHKWFAPMPTPAWRALLFAALVDDPGDESGWRRLWRLMERLVSSGPIAPSPVVLEEAQAELEKSNPEGLPVVADPFCGGGSTLLEAQRLGLSAFGSDLNPVPVVISRMLCELLPKVAETDGIHRVDAELDVGGGPFAGFEADVLHYATEIYEEMMEEIGTFFPTAPAGEKVLAWLWARTVTCPNPACGIETPLSTSWWLSKKQGEEAWIAPEVAGGEVRFRVETSGGGPIDPPKVGRGANFTCVACRTAVSDSYLRDQAAVGGLGMTNTAIVGKSREGRVYLPPDGEPLQPPIPDEAPRVLLTEDPRNLWCTRYGIRTQADLYTPRQLVALEAFSRAVARLPSRVIDDGGDVGYAAAIATFLGLCVGKLAHVNSTQARWNVRRTATAKAEAAFGEHVLPMRWDFAEVNPFGRSVGDWMQIVGTALRAVPFAVGGEPAITRQGDARRAIESLPAGKTLVATDPPYFAHIVYADLSDYFYVWLRRALKEVHPDLFATVATPRQGELVAIPARHDGNAAAAHDSFVAGFTETFTNLRAAQAPEFPMLVVYAHREDQAQEGRSGWEAMLDAILQAGFMIVGTLPLHATGAQRMIGLGTNALATYVVMVCRPRPVDAPTTDRRGLIETLQCELPGALRDLQRSRIAPVDLPQAAIGPGMAVFSRYSSVVESDGSQMTVRSALARINEILDQVLNEQEGDFDAATRFAIAWYRQHGYQTGKFGDANNLANARNTTVDGMVRAGILASAAGKVTLLAPSSLSEGYDPSEDDHICAWAVLHHILAALERGGIDESAQLLAGAASRAEDPVDAELVKELSFLLFPLAEKNGWTQDALAFNRVASAWPEILDASRDAGSRVEQASFDMEDE